MNEQDIVKKPISDEEMQRQIAAHIAEMEKLRWLVRDSDDEEMKESIREYVEGLDEEVRTPTEEYEERLNACKKCVNLREGHCSLCGCMVEIRAAKKEKHCSAIQSRW